MANINEKKLDTISALLKELYDGFAPRLDDEEITAGLQRLWRRSQEYRYGSFIMLVVGPVKSGKSTLVNLLAHRYVSPTDKLECTLRPTIISSVDPGAEPAIEIYSSKDEARKEKDLDLIIDKLRGIIDDDAELREHLTRESYPLSDENIENYIAPSYTRQDNSIITAITTPGGKMLAGADGGKVFLADMPGFDGNRINLSGPLYDAMSRRVDLILFVHSSVSAFNVTSNEYLDKLREYNGSVPVYLIHNIFDAAWWQGDEARRAEVERQSRSEYEEIKRKGFNIEPDYVSCINLGMVTDYIKGTGRPGTEAELEQAWKDFQAVEDRLYDKITTRIGSQRLERCLERTDKLRDDLVRKISDRTGELDAKRRDRETLRAYIDQLDKKLGLTQADYDEIIGNISEDADRSLFKTLAKSMVNKSMTKRECLDLLKEMYTDKYHQDNFERSYQTCHFYLSAVSQALGNNDKIEVKYEPMPRAGAMNASMARRARQALHAPVPLPAEGGGGARVRRQYGALFLRRPGQPHHPEPQAAALRRDRKDRGGLPRADPRPLHRPDGADARSRRRGAAADARSAAQAIERHHYLI